jgi:predicted GNAT family N-acyltransferase
MALIVRPAALSEIVDLRHALLRAGLPRESAIFPGDDAPTTHHLAAILDDRVVGCLTLHLSVWNDHPAYQLRGMATAADMQRQGVGRQLLQAAERFVLTTPQRTVWCNARRIAIAFYQANGWEIVSEEFDIPTAGPHVRMVRTL